MGTRSGRFHLSALLVSLTFHAGAQAQTYHIERIASGLNQPTYVTQAPGDPADILYFTERTSNTQGGFGAVNEMGKIWRYDVGTRTKTLVLDLSLSDREVFNDTGLQTIAFSPDFNTVGAATYRKMYVSLSERGPNAVNFQSTATNWVEEYTMNPDGTFGSPRTILRYNNNAQNNHTIDWVGFDPTSTGAARNYLYISTGDGAFGRSYNNGSGANGRPSQNPNDLKGKILRVDVSGGDAYPTNNLKNFAIPSTNPIPTYNAANPGAPIDGLGEVWATGVRNGYRMSFDRANGDLYFGDVGETSLEEIDFLKAGTNAAGPPVDFGWPQREGMSPSGISGAPQTMVNPFTGVTSLNPIQQYSHDVGFAAIGGYVYRGPITALQGKYFYSDFVGTGQIWMLDFDRNASPASFNGNNGTSTNVSALWQSLVGDPNDPSYLPSSGAQDPAGLDHIVSFGEDNAGNLYIVDFGNRSPGQSNFDGQYPNAGLGEIFRLVPNLDVLLSIDRDTGAMRLTNRTSGAVGIRSLALTSAGAINAAALTPIAGNYDAPPSGDGSVDPDDAWQITSPAGSRTAFAESSLGNGGSLAADQDVELSAGGGWISSRIEDLLASVTLTDGSVKSIQVAFVGNEGAPFGRSDLNFDGQVGVDDWPTFVAGSRINMTALNPIDRARRGDLDGDGDNDFDDFRLFQLDFDAANGAGAFAASGLAVPEPGGLALALAAVWAARARRGLSRSASRRRRARN